MGIFQIRKILSIFILLMLAGCGASLLDQEGEDGNDGSQPAEETLLQGSWRGYLKDLNAANPGEQKAIFLEINGTNFSLRFEDAEENSSAYAKGGSEVYPGIRMLFLSIQESTATNLTAGNLGFKYELQGNDLILVQDVEKGLVINLKKQAAPEIQGYWTCTDDRNNQWSLDIGFSSFEVIISARDRAALRMAGRTEIIVDERTNAPKVPAEANLTVIESKNWEYFRFLKVTSLRNGSVGQGTIKVEMVDQEWQPIPESKALTCQTAQKVG